MKRWVGIDVGGTRIKAGLVTPTFQVEREQVVPLSEADRTEDGILACLKRVIDAVDPKRKAVAVGVGVPGVLSSETGALTVSPNFPAWRDFAFKRRLEGVTGRHVLCDNDANCVIAGEALVGAGAGYPNLIGLTLGTGVGGALVLHRALWRGETGMAGELGHVTIDPNGPPCGCGSRGCLEMYPSVVGLRHMLRAEPVAGVEAEAADVPEQLARAAQAGDTTARRHFATAGRALGQALAGLLTALNIKRVVPAGGVAATWPLMETAARAELHARAFAGVVAGVVITVGTLGDRAGMLGAAMQWKLQPHD